MLLPDMTGNVTERVTVQGTPAPLRSNTVSWGDRDGERSFISSYSRGQIYFSTKDFFGGTAPGFPVFEQRQVAKEGKQYIDLVNVRQGSIRPIRTAVFTPLTAGYYLDGQPLDERIRNSQDVRAIETSAGTLEVTFTLERGTITCTVDPRQQYQIVHSVTRKDDGEIVGSMDIVATQALGGFSIPTSLVVKSVSGTSKLPTATGYQVSNLEAQADPKLFQPSWKNGTRVSDDITGNVYLVSDGKLVLDPLFSKSARDQKMRAGLVFMGATILLFIIGATVITNRLRKLPVRASS
jgi:hypothetical protein